MVGKQRDDIDVKSLVLSSVAVMKKATKNSDFSTFEKLCIHKFILIRRRPWKFGFASFYFLLIIRP